MRPAGRIGLALVALALLVVAVLPPGALADHTYAHRYYILGRVVDSEGYPVSNVTVRVYLDSGTQRGGRGATEADVRIYQSDCDGLYGWNVKNGAYRDRGDPSVVHAFLHVHEPRSSGVLKIDAIDYPYPLANYTSFPGTQPMDPAFSNSVPVMASTGNMQPDPVLRKSWVDLKLDRAMPENRCAGAKDKFDHTYLVAGRLMREIPREERDGGGVVVSEPLTNEPVTITVNYNGGKVANVTVRTDDTGDYFGALTLSEPLQSGTVTLSANGKTETSDADGTFHTTSTSRDLTAGPPWYDSKWFKFLTVAGGIAIVVGGVAYFIGRSPKEPVTGRKGKK